MSVVMFTSSGGNVQFNRTELGTEEENIIAHSLVQLAKDFPSDRGIFRYYDQVQHN
jgi:hypothetical protein